jgi:hypothetical protein
VRYSADEDSPVFAELAAVLEKTAGAPPLLEDHSAEHSIELPAPKKRRAARAHRRR